jgi:adenylate kinase family enzyme
MVGVTATRGVVLVSGAPGADKTTLAVPLAAALGLPLLSKDQIKETLFDALNYPAGQGHRQSRGVMITSFLDRLVRRRGV